MNSKFKTWLQQNGAEILPNTNEFEEIRFKGSEVGVKYKSGKYSNEYAKNAFECYESGRKWDGRPINVGRKNTYIKEKRLLVRRDGTACFYCGELIDEDGTVEHLISLVSGGTNTLGNMVLAHEKCNNEAGNKTIVEKVNHAIKSRINLITKKNE
jgi:5-methylcytosine-specific restriction endonuclease McrA